MPPRFSVIQRPFAIRFPPTAASSASLPSRSQPHGLPFAFPSAFPHKLCTLLYSLIKGFFCGLIYFFFTGTLSYVFGTPTKHVGPCSPPFPSVVTQAVCVAGSFSILMLPLCVCASIHTINLQNCNAGRIEIVQKKKKKSRL